jgi:RNA-directed DNA polymerase
MTSARYGAKPLPELIGELNRHLKGWANYYRLGHPRVTLRKVNRCVRRRLKRHLRRRSQRPWNPPADLTAYQYLNQLGLIYL